VRREEHRHGRSFALVALEVGHELVRGELPQGVLELLQVLHGVGPLPLGALPLIPAHVPVAWQAAPVGLDELPLKRIPERLFGRVSVCFPIVWSLGDHEALSEWIGSRGSF
jgi:hypothetical protein